MERVLTIDLIRGVAVCGILVVNVASFAGPIGWVYPNAAPGASALDQALSETVFVLATSKFISLFGMLFGASLVLLADRAGPVEASPLLTRRYGWLLVIGLLHGAFVWFGDILALYGLIGLFALMCRHWSARTLLAAGIGWYVLPFSLLPIVYFATGGSADAQAMADLWPAWLQDPAPYLGDAGSVTWHNLRVWWSEQVLTNLLFAPATFGLMLFGMGLMRSGWFSVTTPSAATVWLLAGGGVALVATAATVLGNFTVADQMMASLFLSPLVALGYAAAIKLWAKGSGGLIRDSFAALGRVALSAYLMQSLVMTGLFWGGRGLGLMGQVDVAGQLGIVALVLALQLVLARLWLSRFRQGPVEALWRQLAR